MPLTEGSSEQLLEDLERLQDQLGELSFSSAQEAWMRKLLECVRRISGVEPVPRKERETVWETAVCIYCGESFFFRREAYAPEEELQCPECGRIQPLPGEPVC